MTESTNSTTQSANNTKTAPINTNDSPDNIAKNLDNAESLPKDIKIPLPGNYPIDFSTEFSSTENKTQQQWLDSLKVQVSPKVYDNLSKMDYDNYVKKLSFAFLDTTYSYNSSNGALYYYEPSFNSPRGIDLGGDFKGKRERYGLKIIYDLNQSKWIVIDFSPLPESQQKQ